MPKVAPLVPVVQVADAPAAPPFSFTPAVPAKVTTSPPLGLPPASRTYASTTSVAVPFAAALSLTTRRPELLAEALQFGPACRERQRGGKWHGNRCGGSVCARCRWQSQGRRGRHLCRYCRREAERWRGRRVGHLHHWNKRRNFGHLLDHCHKHSKWYLH